MAESNPALFGKLMRQHRTRRGLTRRQLSQAVACAEITLRKIEAGERKPSPQLAQLLADVFKLTLAERRVFLAEADMLVSATARSGSSSASAEHLLDLAQDSSRRYPDEVQRLELDHLEARLDEVRGTLRTLLRTDAQSAQRFAGALSEFWLKGSHMTEGLGWLQQALLLDISPTESRAHALLAAGRIAAFQNSYPRAHRHLDDCLALCQRLHLDDVCARVMQTKGWLALWGDGPPEKSIEFYTQCIEISDRIGDCLRSAHAQCDLALAHLYGPSPDVACAEHFARAGLAHFCAADCAHGTAFAQHVLTQIKTTTGELDEAEYFEAGALAIFRQLGGKRDVAWSLAHLGDIALLRGRLEQARLYREESLAVFLEIDERNAVCVTLHALAQIAREAGDLEQAQQRLIAGLHLARDWDRPYVNVHGLYELAGIQLAMGRSRHATILLGAADALTAHHSLAYPPHEVTRFDGWRTQVQTVLSQDEFLAAMRHGASLTLEHAIALVTEA